MIEKGVDIVGALARSPEKVGKDLGDVAGLGYQDRGDRRGRPDSRAEHARGRIAVIAVASYMSDMYEHLRSLRRARGQRRDDLREALYPGNTAPMQILPNSTSWARERAARHHRPAPAIRTPTGSTSSAWCWGTAHRIEECDRQASWNVDDDGPEVAKDQRVDTTVEDFVPLGRPRPPSQLRLATHSAPL